MAEIDPINQIVEQYETARDLATKKLLQAAGVSAPADQNLKVTIAEANGVTSISVEGGRTIRVPADEFNTLVTNERLDAQNQANYNAGYQAWAANNPQYGPAYSGTSITLFNNADSANRQQGGNGLYERTTDPAITAEAAGILRRVENAPQLPDRATQTSTLSELEVNTVIPGGPVNRADAEKINQATSAITGDRFPGAAANRTLSNATVVASTGVTPGNTESVAFRAADQSKTAGNGSDMTLDSRGRQGTPDGAAGSMSQARPNQLDAFTSYTYGLSLYLMPKESFNGALNASGAINVGSLITLVSAGGGGKRNDLWRHNFYFDELNIKTVIGLNAGSGSTNAIDISFTLIEPMGLSFLDKLVEQCSRLKIANHLSMPYLLEINFFDSQQGRISKLQKFVPIQLLECKIKITTRGTEYRIKAAPYVHAALTSTVLSTPANFNVGARTLQDFFRKTAKPTAASVSTDDDTKKRLDNVRTPNNTQDQADAVDKMFNINSYVDAYNFWMKSVAQKSYAAAGQSVAVQDDEVNDIEVVFDKRFLAGGQLMVIDKDSTPSTTPMTSMGTMVTPPLVAKNEFPVRAGTLVTQVISNAMQQSLFIQAQINDPSAKSPTGKSSEKQNADNKANDRASSRQADQPLEWYKIVPNIKLKKYSKLTNTWSYSIIYNVIPYVIYGAKHPSAPKMILNSNQALKKYNYLYTGTNTSVIDIALDFDFTYYTAVTVNMSKSATFDRKQVPGLPQETDGGVVSQAQEVNEDSSRPAWMPLQFGFRSETGTGNAFNKRQDPKAIVTDSVAESIYSGMHGDMLQIKMRINGDPDFIKQDEILINPQNYSVRNAGTTAGNFIDERFPGGSLPFDTQEILITIYVQMPWDYDESTGEILRYKASTFSGLYRVLTVESQFKQGKFEQVLDCVRYFNQPELLDQGADTGAFARREATSSALGNVVRSSVDLGEIERLTALANANPNDDAFKEKLQQALDAVLARGALPRENTNGDPLFMPNNWAGLDTKYVPVNPAGPDTFIV